MSNGIKQTVNRTFKSSVFVMLFSDAAEALKLYNAVNGTNYKNPEELEINTLDNAIYMGIKNDVSFVIDSRLSLYEHQSTYSPKPSFALFNVCGRFIFIYDQTEGLIFGKSGKTAAAKVPDFL